MALVGEGVRVPSSVLVGGVAVNIPTVNLGRDVPEWFADLLGEAGLVPTIDHPTWMAVTAPRRPVFFVVTPWLEAPDPAAATSQLHLIVATVLDVLALTHGGEPRTVGWVVDMAEPGQAPRRLAVGAGGPPRPISQLQRLRLDGAAVPELDPNQTYEAIARRPRAALWLRLFAPIAGEQRWDIRVLRLCSLLEGIASEVVPEGQALRTPNGTDLLGYDGQPATTALLRGELFTLARDACDAFAIPHATLVANSGNDLWAEAGIWADFRNVIAHDGHWLPAPAFTGLPNPRRRTEASARAAAHEGELEEGLIRYADVIMATTELVLRRSILGGFDPT
jgi:hypothetical protein